jgi:serine/threonine protein kinase
MADETLLARIAIEEGFVSASQVDSVRRDGLPLVDALQARGWLSPEQAQAIRDIERVHLLEVSPNTESGGIVRLDRLLLPCPGCRTSYLIQGRPEGTRFACRRCGRVLTVRRGAGADDAPVPPAPRRLGPWVLGDEIGRGSAGLVYRARHAETGVEAALKVLRDSGSALVRFQEEIRAARRLDHPGIIRLLDAGADDGCHWLALEVVEGTTLAQALADRSIRLRRFVEILEQVARAVHYAHGMGVVHRDLKPANVILDRAGRPRITDFGLAKIDQPEKGASRAGGLIGTPYYMSPEQVAGDLRATDARSDVYALGVMLYEALAGRVPYPGPSLLDVYRGVMAGRPVPPRELAAAAPADLEALCLSALRTNREERPASAAAFADALRRHLDGRAA